MAIASPISDGWPGFASFELDGITAAVGFTSLRRWKPVMQWMKSWSVWIGVGDVVRVMLEFDAEKLGEGVGKVVEAGKPGVGVGDEDAELVGCEVHQSKVARFSTMEISMVLPDEPRTISV